MADRPCNDCGAKIGEPHGDGCDVARCLWTGGQRLQCAGDLAAECCRVLREADRDDLADDLAHYLSLDDPDHDCGEDIWTGEWPGDADAAAAGLWCYWGPDYGERGWVECDAAHPGARPDLNRLVTDSRWDRDEKRWVLR